MIKNFFLSLCSFFIFAALFSCNDDNILGLSIQPGKDKISVAYDTVLVTSKTVFLDSVYMKNSIAALGEFKDHTFGTSKSDYMGQLYCARNFSFPDDVNQIDSAYIYLYYNSWYGDSTALHHVNVYELDNPLDADQTYYSNTDVSKYCSMDKLIAEGTFTTGDLYSTDSVRELSTYQPCVKIPVSMDLADRFFKDAKNYPEKFKTPEAFKKYFNGIYVTTDYGDGSILYVTKTSLELCYDTWVENSTNGERDSFVIGGSYFPITREVKQVNRVEHPDLSSYITTSSDSIDYIYSPAGMFTKVTVPDTLFTKDSGLLSGKTISSLRMTVLATQLDDSWNYALSPPKTLLLISESEVKSFFQNFELNDGINSFLASYDSTKEDYVFDMTAYAQKMIHKMDGTGDTSDFTPFTDMILIPVAVVQNDDGDDIRVDHLITPSAVKVRSGSHPYQPMMLQVLYTKSD
jgi:hypothetical protein